MEWRDEAILLTIRRHGEADAVIEVFAREHGRRSGLVKGGGSTRRAAELQPGAQLSVAWRGRLESQLGAFRAEALTMRAGRLLDDPLALAALASILAQIAAYSAEHAPNPELFEATTELLDALADPDRWPGLYAAWELSLLAMLGFGLDLSSCAATGASQELIYVSPKSGRAVSRAAGAPYIDKLLTLPAFLRLGGPANWGELSEALRLTGYFFEQRVAPSLGLDRTPLPRARLVALAAAKAEISV
ncbi:MAG: DNA repair protein RecO [Neomegalonema sp.]|nr:DNA repair protein RecO [Neomegalonema sp.]